MKPGAGKRKGSAFERDTGRRLSTWLTAGADNTQFVRSVLSGGWRDRGQRHAGDLAANGKIGEAFRERYVIECKHHRRVDIMHMWTRTNGDCLPGWWAKLREECGADRAPVLVFRQNGMPVLVAWSLRDLQKIGRLPGMWATAVFSEADMVISTLDDLMAHIPPALVLASTSSE